MANKGSNRKKKGKNEAPRIAFRPKSGTKKQHKEVERALAPAEVEEVVAEMIEEVPARPIEPVQPAEGASKWRAVASAAGQAPVFAALQPDERGILVAERGLICLPAGEEQFKRLLRLMSALSDAFELSSQVKLRYHEAGDVLIELTPHREAHEPLSHFYDQVATISDLVNAELYIGQKTLFVRYCDAHAPRGYDIPALTDGLDAKTLHLIGRFVSHHWALEDLQTQSLGDLCLQIAPHRQAAAPLEGEFYVLAPAPLYALLARYLRRHQLTYRLAHLAHGDEKLMLFAIQLAPTPSPSPNISSSKMARGGEKIPHFILHYIASLPRVVLLFAVKEQSGPKILLQWQHEYPLHLPHVAAAFDETQWLLLMGTHYRNLCLDAAPNFIAGQELTQIEPKFSHDPLRLEPPSTPRLQLPVHLRPANGPIPPVSALLLTAQEMAWLPQLLYRLPAPAFSQYQLYQAQGRAILLSPSQALEGIPFGTPLRRLRDSSLFIPLRQRLVPALPLPQLYDALNIQPGTYTFLTAEERLDVKAKHFAPLSRRLIASPRHRPQPLPARPATTLPPLRWQAPAPEPINAPASAKKERNLFDRLFKREEQRPKAPPVAATATVPAPASPENRSEQLRQEAQQQEQQHNYLDAALCYRLIDDHINSARCMLLVIGPSAGPGTVE